MGQNRRAQERERAAALAVEAAKRAEAERKAAVEARKIVEIWNARQAGGRAPWFYPTIGAAIAAGFPWLTFSCPACRTFSSVDLRQTRNADGRATLKSNPLKETIHANSQNSEFHRTGSAYRCSGCPA
jgi:hypothetical protein